MPLISKLQALAESFKPFGQLRMGEIPKLKGKSLANYLADSRGHQLILRVFVTGFSTEPGKFRAFGLELLKLSTPGQPLAVYHPGECTVYRGMPKDGMSRRLSSWTKDKAYARRHGKHIETKQLTIKDQALELDKMPDGQGLNEIITLT